MNLFSLISALAMFLVPLCSQGSSVQITDPQARQYDYAYPMPVVFPSGAPVSILGSSAVNQGDAGVQPWPITAPSALPITALSPIPVTAPSPLPISATALPLPSGASTSANQTTTNSSLTTISGLLNSLLALFTVDEPISTYGTSEALASAATDSSVVEYNIRLGNATGFLQRVSFSGSAAGTWVLKKNGTAIERAHSSAEKLHGEIDFSLHKDGGLPLVEGDTITLSVTNNGGSSANFNGRIYTTIPGGEVFAPLDIPGLKLWLDASDTSSFTLTGALVDQWNDKSGEGNHATQVVGANRPTRVAGILNGNHIVRFDGTNDNMDLPDLAPLIGADSTVFIVHTWTTTDSSSGGGVVLQIRDVLEDNFFMLTNDASIPAKVAISAVQGGVDRYGSGVAGADTIINTVYDAFQIWNVFLKSSPVIYYNNVVEALDGTTARTRGAGTVSKLGSRTDGAVAIKGDIAEVLIYNSELSTDNRNLVYTYLSDKHGL